MMTDTEFLIHILDGNIPEDVISHIKKLKAAIKIHGLSTEDLKIVIDVLTSVDLDDSIFWRLLFCTIPNDTITPNVIRQVMLWILKKYEIEDPKKIEGFLVWIATLLDYHRITKHSLDEFYDLIWCMLKVYPQLVSHLIYKLTKAEDVSAWRVNMIQDYILRIGNQPYFNVLLSRFKELNPALKDLYVPPYKVSEDIFYPNNDLHVRLRNTLKRGVSSTDSPSIITPCTNEKKKKSGFQLLPPIQYLQVNSKSSKVDEVYFQDIKNGADFVKNFQKIILPSHSLSLLTDTNGILLLMFSRKTFKEQFLKNLHATLQENLIFRRDVPTAEMEMLLNSVVQLYCSFQQGFSILSNIWTLYLQFWDGHQYKKQIYEILEWFTFKSAIELNRFLLKPLFTLFLSSSPSEMCDVVTCLSNLLSNLYLTISKDKEGFRYILEENTLKTKDELTPIIKSLTKFVSELFKIGLFAYPCNNQIILVAVTFYERINWLERQHDMPYWTIISSNALYHCLFSFNARLLNESCTLLMNYNDVQQLPIAKSTNKMQEKVLRLHNYVRDIHNFLWTSRAFADRMTGHIFKGLSMEDESKWKNYTNLNNSLNLEKHIMFCPYRMQMTSAHDSIYKFVTKNDIVNMLQFHNPDFLSLKQILSGSDIVDSDEEFE